MNHPNRINERLLEYSKKHQLNHQLLLIRFFHERMLYRLSISNFKDNLFLKGGIFLYSFQENKARPTIDIDFLATKISNNVEQIKTIFTEIFSLSSNDGVVFDLSSIKAIPINEQNQYIGIRIKVLAQLGNIKQNIQIDIGFGDIITPNPVIIHYPVLLENFEIPIVNAYTLETAFAEKFQAIIVLAQLNSRMKDFYDIYTLIESNQLDNILLIQAIEATFKNRSTALNLNSIVFSATFYNDNNRNIMWNAFLKKINVEHIEFSTVVHKIDNYIKTIFLK